MRQRSARSAGQDSRGRALEDDHRLTSDGIDAPMNSEQATCAHLISDRLVTAPKREELRARDVAVLFRGDCGDRLPSFCAYV